MRQCDENKSGYIDYTEFVVAAIDKERIISLSILEEAFKSLDSDGSGYLSIDELK